MIKNLIKEWLGFRKDILANTEYGSLGMRLDRIEKNITFLVDAVYQIKEEQCENSGKN
jgi:tetrahydromethanopterin S-methyltransferase subunit G